MSSHPVTGFLAEETEHYLTTHFFPGVVESNETSLETPFLQAEALQLFLTGLVLQTLYQFKLPFSGHTPGPQCHS